MLKNKRNVVFLTFADSKYASAIERLRKETEYFNFDERFFFSERDLPKNFFKGFSPNIYRRGFGYWIWKPFVVDKVLDKLSYGDVLVYSDCGNRWIGKSKRRFQEYLLMLNNEIPILTFQQQYLEKEWTKGDVFQYICPNDWKQYAVTLQLWSGCFILVKNRITEDLIKKWNDIAQHHRSLFTDKVSCYPNVGFFQENRHDQSCFSLLVKQLSHVEISWNEVDDLDGKWEQFGNYPIQAKREHKTTNFLWLVNRVLLRPYHYLQGIYLVVFKHFYFSKRIVWSLLGAVCQIAFLAIP